MKVIELFMEEIKAVKTKKIIVISTVDVYEKTVDIDERHIIQKENLQPYGLNRKIFEEFIMEYFSNYLIIRLPALYGDGLKKNFIYDLINKVPSVILKSKFNELYNLANDDEKKILSNNYIKNKNGDYEYLNSLNSKKLLIKFLEKNKYTSLIFTDSRSKFQFYNLDNLWKDINIALNNNINILNITSEPITAQEIAKKCFNIEFNNIISEKNPVDYCIKSIYYEKYGGYDGYLYTKYDIIEGIKKFIRFGGK
ncbi:hypothetical protein [Peptoanaerobacter stomatis]